MARLMGRVETLLGVVMVATGFVLASSAAESQDTRGAAASQGPRPPALLQDYMTFSVTAPPAALELDPFYKKYVDAHGIPVVSSAKVPDAALLMARDIVQFMLANRLDLRQELIRKKWKLAIMAETEVTYDIPEHRKYRPLPKIDDERLTPEQRENYYKPGGVGTLTGEQYLERARARVRRRAERREHHIMRRREPARLSGHALFRSVDLRPRVLARDHARRGLHGRSAVPGRPWKTRTPTQRRRGSRQRRATPATTSMSTWATGIEAYVFGSGRGPETLLEADPRLYELVREVIPATKMPGNVYIGRTRAR